MRYANFIPRNFTLNDRFEVSGAQDPSAFVQLFERLKRQEGTLKTKSENAC